jgi:predicted RNase H-like HicB family nuclease
MTHCTATPSTRVECVPSLPGTMAYGATPELARAHAQALALRVVAERLEHEEAGSEALTITFRAA